MQCFKPGESLAGNQLCTTECTRCASSKLSLTLQPLDALDALSSMAAALQHMAVLISLYTILRPVASPGDLRAILADELALLLHRAPQRGLAVP